jgi:ectoine hydroxylase-related dioxygenase (phytanoyl-CoA dioxygenase family)
VGIVEDIRSEGVGVLHDAYEPELLERVGATALERFGGLDYDELETIGLRVGSERYMIPMPIEGPAADPGIYASPSVLAMARRLLGDSPNISSFTVVVSFPGAPAQNLHRDHSYLFEEDVALSRTLPPYALTVVVPLFERDPRRGGTRVYPKSHEQEPGIVARFFEKRVLDLPLGSAGVMDYRLAHHGTENSSPVPRPVLFIVYARRWFRDTENFERHVPLSIAPEVLLNVPEEHRGLFLLAEKPWLV